MTLETIENNKRVAKNSLFLFFRMLITLVVSLYTSRVVLANLGIIDYGINNVVAGLVTMFTFATSSLAGGTQRFLTFAIGEKNFNKLQLIFSTAFFVHLIIAILVGLLILLVGYWFLTNKLNIPSNRMDAAQWIFFCSIVTIVLNIVQVPYMSCIIAHENMGVYAYMSIYEALAKLLIAFCLIISSIDRLKIYSLLMMLSQASSILFYCLYSIHKYPECQVRMIVDKKLLKSMIHYSGWDIIGCTGVMLNTQGINILLNMFFGPVVNAARAISVQVNGLALQLIWNFQMAVNPQIVKYYAAGQKEQMIRLIYNNARFAGLLILVIMIPLFFEIDFVLRLWLEKVPKDTTFFVKVILVQTFIQTMTRPIVKGLHATGEMRLFNLLSGGILLIIVPISWLLLKLKISLYLVLIIALIPWMIEPIIDLLLLRKYIGIGISFYYKYVYVNVFLIAIFSSVLPLLFYYQLDEGWIRFILVSLTSILGVVVLTYYFGLSKTVRQIVNEKIIRFITIIKK